MYQYREKISFSIRNIPRKIGFIIVLSIFALFAPFILSLNMTRINYKEASHPHNAGLKISQNLTPVNKSTPPILTTDPLIQNIVELWNNSERFLLNANDTAEFKFRRKMGMFDGIPMRYLENLTNFLLLPDKVCQNRSKLIVLVSSLCEHREYRDGIRRSWGNFSNQHGAQVLFFLGRCGNASNEHSETADIVQGDFVENYNNLTLKTLSRARWYLEFCNNADLVLFCDDDVLVDTEALLKHLPKEPFNLLCNRNIHMPILRDKRSKWYVPEWLLGGQYFPTYCSGLAYLFNTSVLDRIYESSMEIPYIFVDDAFISGYATKVLGLNITADTRFTLHSHRNMKCDGETVFASHGFRGQRLVDEWTKRAKVCGY